MQYINRNQPWVWICPRPLESPSRHPPCSTSLGCHKHQICVPCIIWQIPTGCLFFFFCSEFCHTLKWNGHGVTCVPHPGPPSHLPLHPLPLGLPRAPGPALVSCIQPGLVICFTLDSIRVSMLFSWTAVYFNIVMYMFQGLFSLFLGFFYMDSHIICKERLLFLPSQCVYLLFPVPVLLH